MMIMMMVMMMLMIMMIKEDGDIKDLTQFTAEDTSGELVFWEASFDGNHKISNWKSKTSWNTIPIDRVMNI